MIDVVGQEEAIALSRLEKEGIAAHSEYEQSDSNNRLKVVRTAPAAGEALGEGDTVVYVGDPLSDAAHLNDYFDAKAPHIAEFLESKGFGQRVGFALEGNRMAAGFVNDQNVAIGFVTEPWSHAVSLSQGNNGDVMSESAKIEGIRLVIPIPQSTGQTSGSSNVEVFGIQNPSVSESCAKEVMKVCGFSDMLDSCTQSDVTLPKGTGITGHAFYCCYGESQNNVWSILIKGSSTNGKVVATEIDVSCAPKATYHAIDLSQFGGSVCDFVAYVDEYQ
jgi:hypothetical protein